MIFYNYSFPPLFHSLSSAPIKCGDGSCQPDYISCLKVLSLKKLKKRNKEKLNINQKLSNKHWYDVEYSKLLTLREWEMNENGMKKPNKRFPIQE